MGKSIKYCESCEEIFAERFNFCPNCAKELHLFEMTPLDSIENGQLTPKINVRTSNSESSTLVDTTPVNKGTEVRGLEFDKVELVTTPTAPTQSLPEGVFEQEEAPKEYGGITRLGYFVSMAVLIFVINQMISASASPPGNASRVFVWVAIVISVLLVFFRLKNIGTSRWWILLWFVPFGNLWLGYRCLAQQEGFVETKELDGPGQLVRFVYILIGIVIVILLLHGFFYRPDPAGFVPVNRR